MRRSLSPLGVIFQTNAPPAGHTKGSEGAASAGVPGGAASAWRQQRDAGTVPPGSPAPARLLAARAGGVRARAQVRGGDDSSARGHAGPRDHTGQSRTHPLS